MSQDVKVFSCFKRSYLHFLMVFCCFYDVIVKQYRQDGSFSYASKIVRKDLKRFIGNNMETSRKQNGTYLIASDE